MAYAKDGYPLAQASKIGHLSLIGHPVVRQLVESFESTAPTPETSLPPKTGSIELQFETSIERIITIDGGEGPQTNPVRQEKAITFVQVVACLLRMSDLRHMRHHPMMDPREVKRVIEGSIWYNPAVVPRAGFTVPGLTVRQTIRHIVDDVLNRTRLYDTLRFLVYREWEPDWTIPPEGTAGTLLPAAVLRPRDQAAAGCNALRLSILRRAT
jgi:hypothetical protein